MSELPTSTPASGASPWAWVSLRLSWHTPTPRHATSHHRAALLTWVWGSLTRHTAHGTRTPHHCLLLSGNTTPTSLEGGSSPRCVPSTSGHWGTSLYRLALTLSCLWPSLGFRGAPYNRLYFWLTWNTKQFIKRLCLCTGHKDIMADTKSMMNLQ